MELSLTITKAEAEKWVQDAISDGWIHVHDWIGQEPSLDSLRKGEWVVSIYNYKDGSNLKVWKRDGTQAVPATKEFNMKQLEANSLVCHFCEKPVLSLRGVGFASAACEACYPAAKKKLEFPGWCN